MQPPNVATLPEAKPLCISDSLTADKKSGSSLPAAASTNILKQRMLSENGHKCTNGSDELKERAESNGLNMQGDEHKVGEREEEKEECQPPTKKLRLDNITFPRKPWKLRAVLGEDALLPVPLVPALAAQIINKKETSRLIQKLNMVLPLPTLQHLKRVKSSKDYILLLLWPLPSSPSPASEQHCDKDNQLPGVQDRLSATRIDLAAVQARLTEAGVEPTVFEENFRVEYVAEFAPLTRHQFDRLKGDKDTYWPCNFHEDKYFESLVNGNHDLWSDTNHDLQEMYMLKAQSYHPQSGGVVVDPSTNKIIAEGHGTPGHPLHHTVLNLVDLVARSQGGGALQHTSSVPTFNYNKELRDKKGEDGGGEEEKPTTSHNHLKRYGSIAQLSTVPKTGPYLCTGYDVYLSKEPCHMCSMALIHMRTRRVFYSSKSRDGALGTSDKIHTLHGLNHRYEVYAGILRQHDQVDAPLKDCC
jgi:tRNA-specific adenosine deaminase 3